MNFFYILIPALLLGACAGSTKKLEVQQYHLRNEIIPTMAEPMGRMEKQRRLHGSVSAIDRRNKIGQYYTIKWHDPEGAGQGDVEVLFQYQQGASASRVKQLEKKFPSADASGVVEFAIIGDDYFTQGKVLTWKATLLRNQQILGTRQSYLWQ